MPPGDPDRRPGVPVRHQRHRPGRRARRFGLRTPEQPPVPPPEHRHRGRYQHGPEPAPPPQQDRANRAVLTVEDTGPGLTEAARARVFGHFHRGEAARAEQNGAALGLSIVESWWPGTARPRLSTADCPVARCSGSPCRADGVSWWPGGAG
ncbi:sensor histidine kinase [Crossiella equi]|uniref:sensor histidine kinase n=1 Tax=Crossiella equi TaxID=130796 RepID=UPI0013026F92